MTAMMIAAIAALGAMQIFAFGTVEMERQGYRRQALGVLNGELEYWRARFQRMGTGESIDPGEAEARRRILIVDSSAGPSYSIEPILHLPSAEDGLKYQLLTVRVAYRKTDLADTVEVETRGYVR